MVLSNKKLKQKLRAAKAELLAVSEAQNHSTGKDFLNSDSNSLHLQDLKSLLDSSARKPKLSKRDKLRERAVPSQEGKEDVDGGHDDDEKREMEVDGSNVTNEQNVTKQKKKDKKRKREDGLEGSGLHNVEVKKEKKSKKKKKKKNKKVAEVEVKMGMEVENAGNEGNAVPDAIKLLNSQVDTVNSCKVYVGGIPYYSTEEDIRSYFESCGTITEVDCMTFPESGNFRGIAIVTFKTEAAVKRALSLNGAEMGELFLTIQPYKSTRANKVSDFSPAILEGYNRIYVGNLSWDITEEELRKFFYDCEITSIRFGEDKETGEFRGYAHIDFANSLSLNMALKLDQNIICGRPIKISCAVPLKGVDIKSKSFKTNLQENPRVRSVHGKVKRKNCHECGEKGHIASSCPKKQTPDFVVGINPDYSAFSGKIEQGTCHECGYNGHLSSACPMKQPADLFIASNPEMVNSGKIRRRTCYECGEKGHLSSSCPIKQVSDSVTTDVTSVL